MQFESERRLLHFANQSRSHDFLTDVTVKVKNTYIPAHRLVLSCYSHFFKSMFEVNMKERFQDVVEVELFEGHLIKELIEFMYTQHMDVNNENVIELLRAADYLQQDDAKHFCFKYLQSIIRIENCFDILSAADTFMDDSTKSKAFDLISRNARKILFSDDFKSRSKEVIALCLSNLRNFGVQHKVVYQALLTWIKHDEDVRKSTFTKLFKLVPFTRISTEFLEHSVLEENLVQENIECYNLAMKILGQKLAGIDTTNLTKIVSVGGEETGSKVSTIYPVPCDSLNEVKYPDLPVKVCAHAVVLFSNILYCFGGFINAKSSNYSHRVFALNLNSHQLEWKEMASMRRKRPDLGAAVFQNHIVVTGGYAGPSIKTVEIYLQEVNQWEELPSMRVCRSGHGLVVCKASLYAIGGKNDVNGFESSVEKLESLDEEWKSVASMKCEKSFFKAVENSEFIYALGGHLVSKQTMGNVEKYNPAENLWSLVSNCIIPRFDHAACVMQGKIYVVGGYNPKGLVKKIECYEPCNDLWSIVATSQFCLHRFDVFVV